MASDGARAVTGGVGLKGAERCQLRLHIHVGSGSSTGLEVPSNLGASSGLRASLDAHWIGLGTAKRQACDAIWLLRRMRWAMC
ncbi:MAG: hypothetical protein ACJA0C_001354 [Candidatus Endobugula sp.]